METKPTPPPIEEIRERLARHRGEDGRTQKHYELYRNAPDDIAALLETVEAQAAEIERLRALCGELAGALPKAWKLLALADLLDKHYPDDPNPEAQSDLRAMALRIDNALAKAREAGVIE